MMKAIRQLHAHTTQNIQLCFKKVQLLHEIADYGYIEGELLPEASANKQLTQDVVQENNCSRIVRHLDMAHTRVLRILSPLTDHRVEGGITMDNVPDKREDYVVLLHVEEEWPMERVEHLRNLIHNFLLCYALYLWLSITDYRASDKWKCQADDVAEELKYFKFGNGVLHRPFRPF